MLAHASCGSADGVRQSLAEGVDADARTPGGSTPLMIAAVLNNAEGAVRWPAVTYRMTGRQEDAEQMDFMLGMLDQYQGQVQSLLCADEVRLPVYLIFRAPVSPCCRPLQLTEYSCSLRLSRSLKPFSMNL